MCTLEEIFAVKGEREERQTPVTAAFSRLPLRRRLNNSLFSTTQESTFQVRAIFNVKRTYSTLLYLMKSASPLFQNCTAVTK